MARVQLGSLRGFVAGLILAAAPALAQPISQLPNKGAVAGDAATLVGADETIIYCPSCPVHPQYSRNRAASVTQLSTAILANLVCREADGSPSVSPFDTLTFDQTDGFTVTDVGGGEAEIDWSIPDLDFGDFACVAGVCDITLDIIESGDSHVQVFGGGDSVEVQLQGAVEWEFLLSGLSAAGPGGPRLVNAPATATTPTVRPNKSASTDGMGHDGTSPVIIEGGNQVATFNTFGVSITGSTDATGFGLTIDNSGVADGSGAPSRLSLVPVPSSVADIVAFDGGGNRGSVEFTTADSIVFKTGAALLAALTITSGQIAQFVNGPTVGGQDVCLEDGTNCPVAAGTPPGGADTQVQYNDAGAFGGDAGLTYSEATNELIFTGGSVHGANAASPVLLDGACGATSVTIAPSQGASSSGFGCTTTGNGISTIINGDQILEITPTGSLIQIHDGWSLQFEEAPGNGSNFVELLPPPALTTNQTCAFEDDASFIPDSCVGDGSDGVDGGAAATAVALAANGANCAGGNYPLGVDASGAVEVCTADDDVPDAGEVDDTALAAGAVDGGNLGEITDGSLTADDLGADSVSASELNATGVEAELEAELDLNQLQGTISDTQIANDAVDGGTGGEVTDGSLTAADLGTDSVAADELSSAVESELEALLELADLQGDLALGTKTSGAYLNNVTIQVKTSGSGTYTPTSGMVQVLIICTGGGGGTPAETVADAAVSGGGGGGTAIELVSAATIGGGVDYTVGAASTGAGNQSFVGTAGAIMTCGGGAIGVSTGLTTVVGVGAKGGQGGVGAGGDLNLRGGSGARGTVFSASNAMGGDGGDSFFGGGGRGGSATGSEVGEGGGAFGGGAGGGEVNNDTNIAAASGSAGIIYFIEYIGSN